MRSHNPDRLKFTNCDRTYNKVELEINMLLNQRLELLSELEQTPEEYIPELLNLVRVFRQSRMITMQTLSASTWEKAMDQINNNTPDLQKLRRQKLKQLFESWAILDTEDEQKEALQIIESLEGISI